MEDVNNIIKKIPFWLRLHWFKIFLWHQILKVFHIWYWPTNLAKLMSYLPIQTIYPEQTKPVMDQGEEALGYSAHVPVLVYYEGANPCSTIY